MELKELVDLADTFEGLRKTLTRRARWRYQNVEPDILDGLYTDVWPKMQSRAAVQNVTAYVWRAYSNEINSYFRARAGSQDLMDRGVNTPFTELGGYERDRRPGTSQDFEEQCAHVEAIMSTMPQTLELVGTWYYIDNLTLAQIGKRLGCGVTQAFRHVQHFKQKFKERWDHAEFR